MYFAIVIIAIIVCLLLGLFILIQNPKGGGLSSGFAGSNSIMGVQRTGDFLEKGTWFLAVTLMVLAILVNVVIPKGGAVDEKADELQNKIEKTAPAQAPLNLPAAPQNGGAK
ncbi:MAG: preprotein translocase subunit SecG [Sphingobacteriaceae bacterium]